METANKTESDSNTHKGHRLRMRERFQKNGYRFDLFHLHEALEMILFSCYVQKNTNEIAHALLKKFGSLEKVVCAEASQLCSVEYVNMTVASHIKYYGELLKFLRHDKNGRIFDLSNASDLEIFLKSIYLENKNNTLMIVCKNVFNSMRNVFLPVGDTDIAKAVIRSLAPLCPKQFATVHLTTDLNRISLEEELNLAGEVQKLSSEHGFDYADHCLFDGNDLQSLKNMELI